MIALPAHIIRQARSVRVDDPRPSRQKSRNDDFMSSSPPLSPTFSTESSLMQDSRELLVQYREEKQKKAKQKEEKQKKMETKSSGDMKIKVIRTERSERASSFNKEEFSSMGVTPTASLLSASLLNIEMQNSRNANRAFASQRESRQTETVIEAWFGVGSDSITVSVPSACTVNRFVEIAIRTYEDMDMEPPLSSNHFTVRMADDDDGSIDEDYPPLKGHQNIVDFGVEAVVLIAQERVPGGPKTRTKPRGSVVNKLNRTTHSMKQNKNFLKILIDDYNTVIPAKPSDRLVETLPIIYKGLRKRREWAHQPMPDEKRYYFFAATNMLTPLSMQMQVKDLQCWDLILRLKVPKSQVLAKLEKLERKKMDELPDYNEETASRLTTYTVTKIDKRGQEVERIMAIDKNYVYNSHTNEAMERKTKRHIRTIQDVIVHLGSGGRRVQIIYKDSKEGLIQRDFATDKVTVLEIKNKLHFLMNWHKANAPRPSHKHSISRTIGRTLHRYTTLGHSG